ncbi:hypothetical protein Cgig2_026013 [Carnegiea gigantea]|uniref:Uncharacterized protein n=1 Tax=Carnegiea gigantea TaxID=171969 RepID=A0A9Q1KMX5_9CARY|nr:hypothetical protein Cgig2_026013 [Carnegiea gigantea]
MFVPVRAIQEGWRVYFTRRQRRGFGLPSSSSVPPKHRSTLCRPWRPQKRPQLDVPESGKTCSEIDGCHPSGWKRLSAWALMAIDHLDRDGHSWWRRPGRKPSGGSSKVGLHLGGEKEGFISFWGGEKGERRKAKSVRGGNGKEKFEGGSRRYVLVKEVMGVEEVHRMAKEDIYSHKSEQKVWYRLKYQGDVVEFEDLLDGPYVAGTGPLVTTSINVYPTPVSCLLW